jgi:hypothetical protein
MVVILRQHTVVLCTNNLPLDSVYSKCYKQYDMARQENNYQQGDRIPRGKKSRVGVGTIALLSGLLTSPTTADASSSPLGIGKPPVCYSVDMACPPNISSSPLEKPPVCYSVDMACPPDKQFVPLPPPVCEIGTCAGGDTNSPMGEVASVDCTNSSLYDFAPRAVVPSKRSKVIDTIPTEKRDVIVGIEPGVGGSNSDTVEVTNRRDSISISGSQPSIVDIGGNTPTTVETNSHGTHGTIIFYCADKGGRTDGVIAGLKGILGQTGGTVGLVSFGK